MPSGSLGIHIRSPLKKLIPVLSCYMFPSLALELHELSTAPSPIGRRLVRERVIKRALNVVAKKKGVSGPILFSRISTRRAMINDYKCSKVLE
jgi:hypothetical protein